jgi:hypothetical protein
MCKIMMIAGITTETREKASELVIEMAGIMSETMTDGIGYAATTERGHLFGERWHKSSEAFDVRFEKETETELDERAMESNPKIGLVYHGVKSKTWSV